MSSQFKSGIWHSSKSHGRGRPRGRELDLKVLSHCDALLGELARKPELLIEHLHRLQDALGALPAPYLTALARLIGSSEAHIHEVASFYAHFDVVKEDDPPMPVLTVRVCNNLSCCMAGADTLAAELVRQCDASQVRILRASCVGRCEQAPVAVAGQRPVDKADAARVLEVIASGDFKAPMPDYQDFEAYQAAGGYQALRALGRGERSAEALKDEVALAGIRGLGGAGYPMHRKWEAILNTPHPRLFVVNGDEGEPNTFKDRYLLEHWPHAVLEGMLLTAQATGIDTLYFYLRDEYAAIRAMLQLELGKLEAAGIIKPGQVLLRRGAGAYICGEESALLESLEGKAGLPRHRPPHMTEYGLFGRPTLMHNVESLYWLRFVAYEGGAALHGIERNGRHGQRYYSVSGRVANPGVYLLPVGSTIMEVIAAAGGMAPGHEFAAYQPGGPSSGLLPAAIRDVPLDFDCLNPHGSSAGAGGVVVLSRQDNLPEAARNMMAFFRHESCGQCTPCREGCDKALTLMQAKHWDKALLGELGEVMIDASICGLGRAAPLPFQLVIRYFSDDI